ncbi:hypothetical protein [Clostridium sulfidigenes]|uniref:hypothetical protein n=1 Tax=Clostridium sulfidigenes TaxID=318464 RepID=UPI003F8AC8EC
MKKEFTIKVVTALSYVNIICFIGALVTALVGGIFIDLIPLVLMLFCSIVVTKIILEIIKKGN